MKIVTPRRRMRFDLPACGVVLIGLAAGLGAQNTVPAPMDGVEGGGGTNIPFGSSLACRYQCVYDVEELPWTGPRVLTGISVRPDFNNGNPTPPKGFIEISVLMSTTSRNAATASGTFEENYGTDATWVVQNRVMQLPAQPMLPATPIVPRPANITFMFDVPWAYGLTPATSTLPAPDNLLVEIWIHAQPSGIYRVDNMSSCVAPTSTFGLAEPACSVPGLPPIELTGDQSMVAGSSYTWRIANALPSMPFSVSLNTTNQGGLLGNPALPLPYPLFDPTNPALPAPLLGLPYSAPGCYINTSPAVAVAGVTDMSGEGQAVGNLPAGREFVGTEIFSQAIVLAPTSNQLRVITSLGRSTTICGPLGVTRIYSFYNNNATPPPPPPTSGAVQFGVGLVLEVL